ncbi:MAG: hypothetical protein ACXW4Z_18880, partial [Candidatus Binatia bacterium]
MDSGPFLSNRPRDARWLAAVGAIILLIVQLHVGAAEGAEEPASGIDGSIRQDIRILLRNPPARSTSTYEGLLAAAGEHSVSRLEMTGCEVWTVSAGAADRLLMAAKGFKIPAATIGQEPSMVVQGMHSDARLDSAEKSLTAEAMRHPEAMGMMMAQTPNAAMTEYALTATDDTGAPAAVRLALTDEVTVEAIRQRLEKTAEGYVWHGVIAGTDEPVTLLWWPSGRLTGQVRYQNGIYSIRHFGRSIHGVVAISPRRLPPEHAPMPTAMMKKMKMDRDPFVREGSASQLLNAMDKSAKGLDKQRDRSRNEKQIITDLRASDTRISVRAEQPAGTV